MRIAIACAVFIVAGCAGCKDKPKADEPQKPTAPADAAAQNVLKLPAVLGTPPNRSKPLDAATATALAKIEFDGFKRDVRLADERGIELRYKTTARPKIMVTVSASKCFDCLPMELEKWKPKTDSLRVIAGTELKDHKDTTFELGITDIAKTPYIFTYHVGYAITPPANPENPGIAGLYGTAYALYYNDGVNMIRAVAEYKDDVPKSRQDMVNLTPKEDLAGIAMAFIDRFVHAW